MFLDSAERRLAVRNLANDRRTRTLPGNACKVLAPEAFVRRLRVTLAVRDLDESLLGRCLAVPATGGKVHELASIPLECPNLIFREGGSGTGVFRRICGQN